jgi:hypothetical protein
MRRTGSLYENVSSLARMRRLLLKIDIGNNHIAVPSFILSGAPLNKESVPDT